MRELESDNRRLHSRVEDGRERKIPLWAFPSVREGFFSSGAGGSFLLGSFSYTRLPR